MIRSTVWNVFNWRGVGRSLIWIAEASGGLVNWTTNGAADWTTDTGQDWEANLLE